MLVQHTCLIRGMLASRIGVEGAAQRLEGKTYFLGAAVLRSLEDHVLQHMRDSHLLSLLMQGCRADPCPKGNRPHSRHIVREYGQSIRENGPLDVRPAYTNPCDHARRYVADAGAHSAHRHPDARRQSPRTHRRRARMRCWTALLLVRLQAPSSIAADGRARHDREP